MPELGGLYLPLIIQNVTDLEQGNRVLSGKVIGTNTLWLACYYPHCRGKLEIAYIFLQALTLSDEEDLGLVLVLWEMTRLGNFCCVDI